jgi:hypothetical protein
VPVADRLIRASVRSWLCHCLSASSRLLLAPFNHCISDIITGNDVLRNEERDGHWVGKTRRAFVNIRDNKGCAPTGVWMVA